MAETPPVLQFQCAAGTGLGCFNLPCLSVCHASCAFCVSPNAAQCKCHTLLLCCEWDIFLPAKSCCSSTAFWNSWYFLMEVRLFIPEHCSAFVKQESAELSVSKDSQFFACKAEGRCMVVKAFSSILLYCWSRCKRYFLVVQLFKICIRETNQLCKDNKINAIISARQM